MDMMKVKAFLTVAKLGSFSKAAEEFSYTPSAFSHIADSLEEELGVKLFKRTHKGVEITVDGKKLFTKFLDMLDAEKELFEAAEMIKKENSQILRIGAYSSVALKILPEILESFKKIYKDVKISVFIEDNLNELFEKSEIDILFSDVKPPEGAVWCPMMRDEYVAVVPSGIFKGKKNVSKEELYNYPMIRIAYEALNEYFNYGEFKEIIPVKSIENLSAISMVKENMGITVLPELVAKNNPKGVKVLRLNPPVSRTIGFVYNSDRMTLAVKNFVKHLKENYEIK